MKVGYDELAKIDVINKLINDINRGVVKIVPSQNNKIMALTMPMFEAYRKAHIATSEKHGQIESANAGYNAMLLCAPEYEPLKEWVK